MVFDFQGFPNLGNMFYFFRFQLKHLPVRAALPVPFMPRRFRPGDDPVMASPRRGARGERLREVLRDPGAWWCRGRSRGTSIDRPPGVGPEVPKHSMYPDAP